MYRHTQTGAVIPAVIVASTLASLVVLLLVPLGPAAVRLPWIVALTLVLALLAALAFRSLTITVGEGVLAWSFGAGLVRKWVRLEEVAHAEAAAASASAGWGIHWTRAGWLYNVAGRQAVLVRLHGGKQFLLGTDEPQALVQAIRAGQAAARG